MNNQFIQKGIFFSVLLAGLVPATLGLLAHFYTEVEHVSEPLHAFVEVSGGCIALAVGALLLARVRRGDAPHLAWAIGALLLMGCLDMAHGAWEYGSAWSWLRALSTCFGGCLFALVSLPSRFAPVSRPRRFMVGAVAVALTIILMVWIFRASLPPMWTPQGGYTLWTKCLNTAGSLGFLVASAFFLRRYAGTGFRENLVFGSQTLLFATAGLLIWFSRNWHLEWWLWHGLRLGAYAVIVVTAYEVVSQMYKGVLRQNLDLERLVSERTADLQRSKALFERMAEASPDLLFIYDLQEDRNVYMNSAVTRILGYSVQEFQKVPGGLIEKLGHPDDVGRVRQWSMALETAADNEVIELEHRVRHKDGSWRWILARATAFERVEKKVKLVIGISSDVTRRKEMEEALRRSGEWIQTIVDAVPSLLSFVDRDLRYRLVNRAYQRWFNRPLAEVTGRPMQEVVGEAAFEQLRPRLQRALAGEEISFDDYMPYSAGARWVHGLYMPHFKGTTVDGLVIFVTDITERKQAEQQLAEAKDQLEHHAKALEKTVAERTGQLRETVEELEAFSYSIAHDMRAPLRAMHGFAGILIDEHASQLPSEAQHYLQRISASAQRLDKLIQEVLNYSRIIRQDLPMEKVDPQQLIREIIDTYPNLNGPNITIELRGTFPPLIGNTAALTQVISNLLGNAVKFVKRGLNPSVRVWAETLPAGSATEASAETNSAEVVRLWFEDNGIGVPPGAEDRIFGMFQRINRTQDYEGTGMGLAIVRKAVERMGGKVGVESQPGQGSRFWVQLRKAGNEIEKS